MLTVGFKSVVVVTSLVSVGFDSDFFNVARLSSRQKEFLLFFVSGSNLTSFFLLLFF